jgi:tRNA pseudouridine38-40 synthase
MPTLKLTIAYDGTAYAGWQFQLGQPTVQEALENAIAKVTGQRVRVLASGRTDAGVHALGQVVGFRTNSALSPEVLLRALNANLPQDIAVLEAAEAAEGFHPTYHAVRKRYRYLIHDGPVRMVLQRHFVWHYGYGRLDAPAMQRAATALVGKHDFRSFESSGARRKTSVRTVFELHVQRGRAADLPSSFGSRAGGEGGASDIAAPGCAQRTVDVAMDSGQSGAFHAPYEMFFGQGRAGERDLIAIEVEANGFLYNMVRTIVGTLVQVGRGERPESWPGEVLRAADRSAAGPTAPPQGLCLVKVEYASTDEKVAGNDSVVAGSS